MKILVTGGAGFIGSELIRHLIQNTDFKILNLDKLTYAANLTSLKGIETNSKYKFVKGDICDSDLVGAILSKFKPDKIVHLAAESHVDNSISGPSDFINTNIIGTFILLQESVKYFLNLNKSKQNSFLFHHVSTDEVFGDLPHPKEDKNNREIMFTEKSPYKPSSPYSATKASSDHLVRSWHRTFDLPVIITNCSNNYGPFQHKEKLIPLTINKILNKQPIPIYGAGDQIRDWLYVNDHARALEKVFLSGTIGETYNIGGGNELQNIEVVKKICEIFDQRNKKKNTGSCTDLINYVSDRPGHDRRYSIDSTKIQKALNWKPIENFESGIEKTVNWYINNF